MSEYLYVGAYSNQISVFKWDKKHLKLQSTHNECENSSFGAFHPSRRLLYMVSEFDDSAYITAYEVIPECGKLSFLNQIEVPGAGLCHISVLQDGKAIAVAAYSTGHVVICRILPDGKVGEVTDSIRQEGCGLCNERQNSAHAHGLIPFENELLCCDLGLDRLLCYNLTPEFKLIPSTPHIITPEGEGPRHGLFCCDCLYVVTELKNNILVYRKNYNDWQLIQSEPIIPNISGENYASELQISANGKHLYASVRGSDTITHFNITPNGDLAMGEVTKLMGKWPRMFSLSVDGCYMFIAFQNDNRIMVLRIEPKSGIIKETITEAPILAPAWIVNY